MKTKEKRLKNPTNFRFVSVLFFYLLCRNEYTQTPGCIVEIQWESLKIIRTKTRTHVMILCSWLLSVRFDSVFLVTQFSHTFSLSRFFAYFYPFIIIICCLPFRVVEIENDTEINCNQI